MEPSQSGASVETDTLKFPFLGTLENGESFEYLLLNLNSDFAEIALLQWFLNRHKLHINDQIDLHLPYSLSSQYNLNSDISVTVVAARHSEEIGGEIYQVSFSKGNREFDAKAYSLDQVTKQLQAATSPMELLTHLIKDSMFLKAGVRVYFKHLIPYFSRISNFSQQEYIKLELYFLHDIESRIKDNEVKLEKLYHTVKKYVTKTEEIPIHIDLEVLREILESEISLPLFNVVFSKNKKLSVQEFSKLPHSQYGIFMYISAIKSLEKRLYYNYNNIVIIYLKSL